MTAEVVLHICTGCGAADLSGLRAAVARAFPGGAVKVAEQPCMNGCARPVSVALQGAGRATYFFAGVDTAGDADDIVATIRAYRTAPAGWIADARGCGRLRLCLVGRVPSYGS